MAFTARYDSKLCPSCHEAILAGQLVFWDEHERMNHVSCEEAADWLEEPLVLDDRPLARVAYKELEEAQIAPLQRPVCPQCFLELPVSMVCGVC